MSLLRRKPIEVDHKGGTELARTLSWPHLVALGEVIAWVIGWSLILE